MRIDQLNKIKIKVRKKIDSIVCTLFIIIIIKKKFVLANNHVRRHGPGRELTMNVFAGQTENKVHICWLYVSDQYRSCRSVSSSILIKHNGVSSTCQVLIHFQRW